MNDEFDKDLKKRISEVFDNYEDTSADEGWQRLREKFPEEGKNRSVVWLWWSSAAAVILVFLGILWLKQTPEKQQQFTALKTHRGNIKPSQKPADITTKSQPDSTLIAKNNSTNSSVKNESSAPAGKRIVQKKNQSFIAASKLNQHKQINNGISVAANTTDKGIQNTPAPANAITAATVRPNDDKVVNNANIPSNVVAATRPDTVLTQAGAPNTIASAGNNIQQNGKPGNQILAYNIVPSKQKVLSGDRRVKFGVYAATYFNYAKGSSNQFNIGAGITSDIRITKKLKLSTGIAIAQNSLSYGGQPSFAVPQGINLAPLALYSANTLQYSISEPSFKSYNASLVSIDVPVNLKYTFDPGKSETYILAGLSSGAFLNETYTYNFTGAQAQNQLVRNNAGGFYFGRMLNLAVGTGYRFGNNRLIIEPFLKYPLDGMGAQQLRFGSGGVNVKFNIPSIRK